MRHSQGDHWDLMVIFPVGSYAEYYQPARIAKRQQAQQAAKLDEKFKEQIAWQEDLFAYGPALADLRKAFADGAFFHVEMFVALPGKFAELYKEREMENAYSKASEAAGEFYLCARPGSGVGHLHHRRLSRPETLRRERRRFTQRSGSRR